MPIYNDDLTAIQYKIVTKISILEFEKMVKVFNKAKDNFPYKNKAYFLKTVDQSDAAKSVNNCLGKAYRKGNEYIDDLKTKAPYIALFYNDPKYAIPDALYINMMESLIFHANKELTSSSKYKFDIVGSWVNGKIILLEKK